MRKRQTSNTFWPALLGVAMFIGFMAVIVVPPVIGSPDTAVPLPSRLSFETLPGDAFFQRRMCDCNTSWDFATDERNVSNAIFPQVDVVLDPRFLSSLAAFWGQVVDHDLVHTLSNASDGTFSLPMTPFDDVLIRLRRARHRILPNGCREITNDISSVLDASFVYGGPGHETLLQQLRESSSCRMRTSPGNLLPFHPTSSNSFIAGDARSTEHSVLASMHTLFVREHNRLCALLEQQQPTWTNEERFWKVKEVVTAKVQHITYNEWLPALMGSQISLLDTAPIKAQDTRIAMEFSVAAYRFGHSMIPDDIGDFSIPDLFFNRTLVVENGVEPFIRGAYETRANAVDHMLVDGLRNFLFMAPGMTVGEDLMTRNLFRGREVGLGTYAQVAACYGTETQNNADELTVGIFSEPLVPGSSLPRTIAVIVAEQFRRIRDFDPRFYTRTEMRQSLGGQFVAEVFATTMASVIRANTNLTDVPDRVFFTGISKKK